MKAWDRIAQGWALAGALGFLLLAGALAASRLWVLAGVFGIVAALWYGGLMGRWERRRRLSKEPFPEAWARILGERVDYYRALDEGRRSEFARQVRWFLEENRFTGVAGQEATEELKLLAAASAVMLVFGRPGDEYPRISEILFYPGTFDEDYRTRGADRPISGQNTSYGAVLLSAPDLQRSFRDGNGEAYHVGVHEFAHALDRQGDRWDGLPQGFSAEAATLWSRRLDLEMKAIQGGRSALCAYGASDHVEFFAVATETYFKTPDALRRRHPELFAVLETYYGPLPSIPPQPDPASGKRRPDEAPPPGPREPAP